MTTPFSLIPCSLQIFGNKYLFAIFNFSYSVYPDKLTISKRSLRASGISSI